jgi:general secretion pathway protein M
MNLAARQAFSALGLFAVIAALFGGAVSTALGLRDDQASVAALEEQAQALDARARRVTQRKEGGEPSSPFVDAATVTLAGAVLQQRVEAAVAAANGRLASSKVDVGGRANERRVALEAELTISQPDMQKLLYDLESGRPYLFVDSFEARAPDKTDAQAPADMRVSLTLSGQWGGPK